MVLRKVYRVSSGPVAVELVSSGSIEIAVIDGHRVLSALLAEDEAREFFEALSAVISENPSMLMERRKTCYWYEKCSEALVPDRELLARLIKTVRGVLVRSPRPTPRYEEECGGNSGECWLWSPVEARAAAKAALLLDIAAALLEHPELVDKLPSSVELLARKTEEASLDRFLGGNGSNTKPEEKAEAAEAEG